MPQMCNYAWNKQAQLVQLNTCITMDGAKSQQLSCLMCNASFVRKLKGWNRYSLRSLSLSPSRFGGDGFICSTCASVVKKGKKRVGTPVKTGRKRVLSTPVRRTPKVPRHSMSPGAIGFRKDDVSVAIQRSKYGQAFKALLNSKPARGAFDRLVIHRVRKEMRDWPQIAETGHRLGLCCHIDSLALVIISVFRVCLCCIM